MYIVRTDLQNERRGVKVQKNQPILVGSRKACADASQTSIEVGVKFQTCNFKIQVSYYFQISSSLEK